MSESPYVERPLSTIEKMAGYTSQTNRADSLEQACDFLSKILRAVELLHQPVPWYRGIPDQEVPACPTCGDVWPCPTASALGGVPPEKTKWGVEPNPEADEQLRKDLAAIKEAERLPDDVNTKFYTDLVESLDQMRRGEGVVRVPKLAAPKHRQEE